MSDAPATGGDPAVSIPRITQAMRESDAVGFAALRALAIDKAQAASGLTWTDYNLHDPGLTLLEAACYAMTELVYRSQFEVVDHLSREKGGIDFDRQALYAPYAIFPSRATTAADIRRVLLDRNPHLRDVRLAPPVREASPPNGEIGGETGGDGLHHLRLMLSDEVTAGDGQSDAAFQTAGRRALADYRRQRGLGEDVDDAVTPIGIEWRRLRASIDLEGSRDPIDVLAEIFDVCEACVAPAPTLQDPRELQLAGWSLEDIFTGPHLISGYIAEGDLSERNDILEASDLAGRPDRLPLSDVRIKILAIEGVAAVGVLALDPEGEASPPRGVSLSGQVLSWNGDRVTPRLRTPSETESGGSAVDTRAVVEAITLWRRGVRVSVDAREVAVRYADLRAGHRKRLRAQAGGFDALAPPPVGRHRPSGAYQPLGELFPPLYGLGRQGLPAGVDPAFSASVAQFKAYLALYDQLLASAAEQLRRIPDLFSVHSHDDHLALSPTYWPATPDGAIGQGARPLYAGESPEAVRRKLQADHDDVVIRRNQVLDYLLALYGQTYSQNTLSQFLGHLDSRETAEALIENKAAYLKSIVSLSRDRSAGFDYMAPLWGLEEAGATPGIQRRIALLLGFRRPLARRLTAPLKLAAGGVEQDLFGQPKALQAEQGSSPPADGALQPLEWPSARRPSMAAAEARSHLTQGFAPAAGLFRLGVDRRAYRWRPDHRPGRQARAKSGTLLLGSEDQGRWWSLGPFASEREAGHVADWLRHHMLEMTAACEGLHVVEPILLRPRGSPPADLDRFALSVTLVFPAWTARTARSEFRHFADETARINVPAHLAVSTVWLDIEQMDRFEDSYEAWMQALRDYSHGRAGAAVLDESAQAVLDLIGSPAASVGRRSA